MPMRRHWPCPASALDLPVSTLAVGLITHLPLHAVGAGRADLPARCRPVRNSPAMPSGASASGRVAGWGWPGSGVAVRAAPMVTIRCPKPRPTGLPGICRGATGGGNSAAVTDMGFGRRAPGPRRNANIRKEQLQERADMGKRVIFTGGSGKAGRHAVAYLVDKGYEVLNLDLVPLEHARRQHACSPTSPIPARCSTRCRCISGSTATALGRRARTRRCGRPFRRRAARPDPAGQRHLSQPTSCRPTTSSRRR